VDGRKHRGAEGRNLVSVPERNGESGRREPVAGLSRKAAVDHLSTTYGWDPRRVDAAILKLADYFKSTNEVYYPDPSNYREVVVVWIRRTGKTYEITEEKRAARLARPDAVRYSKRVPNGKAALRSSPSMEAITMATRTAAKRPTRAKAKPAPEPEPEVEEELEELEDEAEVDEDEVDEDAEDEDAEDEDEESEDEEEDEEQDEDEDEDEEVEDEAADEPAEEPEKDYRIYAEKPITVTMEDFAEWLEQEVAPLDSMDPVRLVALAGTLRMEFQKSQFCKDRREKRREEARAAKAPKPKTVAKAAPAKATKTATKTATPAAKTTKAKAAAPAPAPAKPARKTGAAAGRPAPRSADRPTAKKPAARRGKVADTKEAPF
jgi:hypothetical protein